LTLEIAMPQQFRMQNPPYSRSAASLLALVTSIACGSDDAPSSRSDGAGQGSESPAPPVNEGLAGTNGPLAGGADGMSPATNGSEALPTPTLGPGLGGIPAMSAMPGMEPIPQPVDPNVSGATIINDQFWKDTSGTPIYSQGGGMLQVGDTYYWYGVKYRGAVTYAANPTTLNSDTGFAGITTYSSKDLVNWTLEATDMPGSTGGWFGRLGVAYNASTKKYVLVAQGGGGLYFATSDRPNGGFVLNNIQATPPGIANGGTGDQTIFQDDDGQAWLVSSSKNGRANAYVSRLRPSDFLAAENAILVYRNGGREGNCMFKYEGTYYFCSSDLHGWNTSQTYCVSATDIRGPYGAEFVLEGTQADYSHVTQSGFFFNVNGTEQTTVVYAGDRWSDFAGNGLGFNQWMPLSFAGGTPYFHSLSAWTLNAATGDWKVAPENNWILNPSFEADRISVTTPIGWTTSGGVNATDRRNGRWSWQLTGNGSVVQTITNLPNGTYTLSVWARSSGAGAQSRVKKLGGAEQTGAIPANNNWTNVTLEGLVVSDGQAEVSVTSSGQTVQVDDFTLSGD